MNRFYVLFAAVAVALCAASGAIANVETPVPTPVPVATACVPEVAVACVPQPAPVVLQTVAQPQYVYAAAPPATATMQVAKTREKRPGLLNRIKAFRNTPRRQETYYESVQVPVAAAVAQPVVYQQACVGASSF